MGGLSINLQHLPYEGTVLEQPYKLKLMFDIIKNEVYRIHKRDMDRLKAKK